MKAILVFTTALMTGASIYGVANYKQLSNSKDFKELYTEKKTAENTNPVSVLEKQEKKEPVVAQQSKTEKVVSVRSKTKRKIASAIKPQKTEEILAIDKPNSVEEEQPAQSKKVAKKTKRLNRKMFSRAALKE